MISTTIKNLEGAVPADRFAATCIPVRRAELATSIEQWRAQVPRVEPSCPSSAN